MKKLTKLLVVFTLIGMGFTACKDTKGKENAEEANTEQTKKSKEVPETMVKATVLNANLASENDLKDLGLSSEIVSQILEERPFLAMTDFDALLGSEIDKTELYKKIFVPFNLNTTEEANFKMIPGVGDRMAHEFEEYRPYISIQQFRKEIGKYVDEDEVARYENYVFVPIELNTASEEDIKALPGVGNRMAHEFEEYRPYTNMAQFRKEISKYVDDKELARLERFVYLKE